MNKTLKKYLISSLITFAAFFCMAILPDIKDLTLESLKSGALIGIAFTGTRAGVKALIEGFLAWYSSRNQ